MDISIPRQLLPVNLRLAFEYDIEIIYPSPLPSPNDIVIAPSGEFLVAVGDVPVIKKVTPEGLVSNFITLPRPAGCLAYNAQGDLFAGSAAEIWKISPEGKVTIFSRLGPDEFISKMAFGPDGYLYTVQWGSLSPDIKRISPEGEATTFATGLLDGFDIKFSPSGELFVTDTGSGNLYKVDGDGRMTAVVTGLWTDPSPIAFDKEGNLLLRTGWRGKTENGLYKVSLPDGSITPILLGPPILSGSDSIVVDDSGNIFLPAATHGTIQKVTPEGAYELLVEDWHNPEGLAVGPSGDLFIADHSRAPFAPGRVLRLDMDGNVSTFFEGMEWPIDLAFDGSGNLFVADLWAGQILKITPQGQEQIFADNLPGPESIAFDATSGDLFIYLANTDEVVRINEQGEIFPLTVDFGKDLRAGRVAVNGQGNLLACVVYMENIGVGPTYAKLFEIKPGGEKRLLADFADYVPLFEMGIAVAPSGDSFLLAHPLGGFEIRRVTRQGDVSVFAGRVPVDPFGIAIAPNGDIFFSSGTGIYRIFPMKEGIIVDGKGDDWQGFRPLITDPQGDTKDKLDIKALYGFTDDKFLYLMAEFYEFADFWDTIISLDLDNDGQPDYRLGFSRDRTFDAVALWDLRVGEELPQQRRGLYHIDKVAEMRIPLSYIGNRNEFGIQIGFNGQRDEQFYTIDFTDWAHLTEK